MDAGSGTPGPGPVEPPVTGISLRRKPEVPVMLRVRPVEEPAPGNQVVPAATVPLASTPLSVCGAALEREAAPIRPNAAAAETITHLRNIRTSLWRRTGGAVATPVLNGNCVRELLGVRHVADDYPRSPVAGHTA